MKRSMFLELLDEEAAIPKGGPRAFIDFKDLCAMLDARKQLIEKAGTCRDQGELTGEQYEQLVALIRKNIGLPES